MVKYICPTHKQVTYTAGPRSTMHWTGDKFCSQFKKDCGLRMTVSRPKGTVKQLPSMSQGIHPEFNLFYIRGIK